MSERDTSREEAHARTMELIREVRLIEVQTSRLVDEHLAILLNGVKIRYKRDIKHHVAVE